MRSMSNALFAAYRACRASMPPSSTSSRSAWAKASTVWVGDVKRHLPPSRSMVSYCAYRSSDRLRALPRLSSSRSRRQMMNEKPGTPWMHSFALLTRKSMPHFCMGISTPAKLDMASTMNVLPACLTTLPTASISLSRPDVVSLCTMATCVMEGSAARYAATFSESGTVSNASAYSVHGTPAWRQISARRTP